MAIKHFKKRRFFFTSFLIVFLGLSLFHFEFVSIVKADSNTWQVGRSSDDCYRQLVPSAFSSTGTTCRCGDFASDTYDYSSGMRFTNLNIPQGSTINSAYLQLNAYTLYGAIPETFIEGEASDSAATFSDATNYDARPRTSASVSWTPPAWVADTWYTSSDIKTVIQEIVNRGGWASGNALVLFWRDAPGWGGEQKRVYARSYDGGAASAPKLEVTWIEEEDEYSYTFIETFTPSALINKSQEHGYIFTQTLVTTSTLSYGTEAVYTFTQTITPSETITYYQEQAYTFTTTLDPFDALQSIGAEVIYVLTETLIETTQVNTTQEMLQIFYETLKPTTILNYAMELAEVFITNIETLTPQTTPYFLIPEVVEEVDWAMVAMGIAMLAFVIAVTAFTTKKD